MKFSVVIPTHNRLDLLRDAVETVLRQGWPDWELVVLDNASTDDIRGYVTEVGDNRIRYARSDEFLPVTESWNRAIDLASGEYVTFLGDDDGLTPSYFTRLDRIIREFHAPEVLYCALYQFLHPGVAPWERRGYVADLKNGFFFVGRREPFVLPIAEAKAAVRGSIGLRRNFTFNIQAFVFSRAFLNRIRRDGPIFRAPFPDYYLANIAFAKAGSVVVVPIPMSIAGVSKASFGYTLFNGLEDKGAELLNAKLASDPLYSEVEQYLLPGPLYNTNYALTMEHVARYARDFVSQGVAYGRYRRLQIFALLTASSWRIWKSASGRLLWRRIGALERLWTLGIVLILFIGRFTGLRPYVQRAIQRALDPYGFHPVSEICDRGNYSRLIEVFEAIGAGTLASHLSQDSTSQSP